MYSVPTAWPPVSMKSFTPTMICSLRLDRLLGAVRALGNLTLRVAVLDRRDHAAHAVDRLEVGERLFFESAASATR